MIKECQDIFEIQYSKYGDNLIFDNHIPKDGTYIIIKIDQQSITQYSSVELKFNKRTGEMECDDRSLLQEIKKLDYYSQLLEMNKPIDPKKVIHSNNYMSFFVKKDSIKLNKVNSETIRTYYEILKEPRLKYIKKKQSVKLYDHIERSLGTVNMDLVNKIEEWMLNNFNKFECDLDKKDYFKLFFILDDMEDTIKLYKNENRRYIIPNIYNSNDYNVVVGEEILGLPNDNMGMNSKKPFLGNVTRGCGEIPYLLNEERAFNQSKFFDYLMGLVSKGYYNVFYDNGEKKIMEFKNKEYPNTEFTGYFTRLKKEKNEVAIMDYDIVTKYTPELYPPFYYKKFLFDVENNDNQVIRKRKVLFEITSKVIFSNYLETNIFTEPADISITDNVIKQNLISARDRLFSWIVLCNNIDILPTIKTVGQRLIMNSIKKGYMSKAKQQMNLVWSYIDYLGRNNMMEEKMMNAKEKLKLHINNISSDWNFESDEEYYFAVGQLVQYYLTKSKAGHKNMSIINPYLSSKKDEQIKKMLSNDFKKYNYDIEYNQVRFKKIYSNIMLYRPSGKIDSDMLQAGLLSDNLLFMKKDREENING